MSLRYAPRGLGRWLAVAFAVWLAAAAHAARSDHSDQQRILALMDQAKHLAGDACTATQFNRAMGLYGQGCALLSRSRSVTAGVRCQFLLDAADYWERRGDYDLAARVLREAAKVTGILSRARVARRLKEMEPLAKRWEEAVALRNAGKKPEAIAAFERIARDYPAAAASALFQQAQLHLALEHFAQAESKYRQVATTSKGTYHGELALNNLGSAYYLHGKYEDALAARQEFLRAYGDEGERGLVHLRMGGILVHMGRRDEALKEIALARTALAHLPEGARQMVEAQIAEEEAKARALKGN